MKLLRQVKIEGDNKLYTDEVCILEDVKEIILKDNNGRCDKIIFEMPKVSLSKVITTYIGKIGCMCGCVGKYSYLESSRKEAGENRSYEITDDEISSNSVNFIINKLIKEEKRGIEVINNYIYSLDIGERRYALYLQEPKNK